MTPAQTPASRGRRGARERILQAATELFYTRGIHATGVAALMETAHVSPRTFYVHFPTKNALVEAYLRRVEAEQIVPAEAALGRDDLPPEARILAIFDPLDRTAAGPLRGCPFHNAAVEVAGELVEIAELTKQHKRWFRERLTTLAAEAGAVEPENLGRQLAVVYEGANALAASIDDNQAFVDAKNVAETLVTIAMTPARG